MKNRHAFWASILRPTASPIVFRQNGFHAVMNHLKKSGPYLIIGNHTADADPIIVGSVFDFPIYFVASDQLLNQGFTSMLLKYFFAPIGKTKSLPDITVITTIKRILNEGGSVGIFVEGNVTMTGETIAVPSAIGKLVKMLNVPVIFYISHGLSFVNPRWSVYRKHGPTSGAITRIMQPSEFIELSGDEMTDVVRKEIYVNAYDKDPKIEYKGKKIAEGLQRLVFLCPKCHQPFGLTTKDNHLSCSKCGFVGTYDTHGYLVSDLGAQTLIDLNAQTLRSWVEYLKQHPETKLDDPAKIFFSYERKRKRERKGRHTFELNQEGVIVHRWLKADEKFGFADIIGYAMQRKDKLIVYFRNNFTLFIKFRPNVSPYQYLTTLQIFHNQYLFKKGDIDYDDFAHDDAYTRLGL
ncbi:MAG: 1-acyl-sn-glycerol-3-phosphate acyltransferase [Firmicutes bacterium]|nr:1-acyl-sn-glycerol-3-phosphate acyltransferase [Bacillota bacterium]